MDAPRDQRLAAAESCESTGSIRTPRAQQQLAEMLSHFRTLDPLASPPVETDVLAPLLAEGDFLSVSGEAGCGKTMLSADLILGWAHPARKGAALGGLFQFNPVHYCCGKAGIIDSENAAPRWESLLRRKMEAEDIDPLGLQGTVEYVRPSDIGLHREANWSDRSRLFADALAARGIRFAVIDSLGRTWSPDDLNSTAWVQQGLPPFRLACRDYGISVLALTHTRRRRGSDDIEAVGPLGSSLQEAQVDAQVMMTMNPDGRGCRLKLRKCRRAYWIRSGSSIALEFTRQLGYRPQDGWETIWPHQCPDEPSDLEVDSGTRTKILQLIEEAQDSTLSSTAIAAALRCSSHTVTNHLSSLERTGRVVRQGNGPTTRWRLPS